MPSITPIKKVLSLLLRGQFGVLFHKVTSKFVLRGSAPVDYSHEGMSTKVYLRRNGLEDLKVTETPLYEEAMAAAKKKGIGMGGGGNVELLSAIVNALDEECIVLETGVSMGWSSAFILEYLKDGLLVSTDLPYPGQDTDIGFLVDRKKHTNWILLLGLDSVLLPSLTEVLRNAALVHYDSDKNYRGKLRSLLLIFDALPSKAWLVVDDISDNSAFDEFCRKRNLESSIVYFENHRISNKKQYVGVVRK